MDGHFLQDLALVMLVAGVVTVVFHRLRQPVVLGYILAGLIVGPYTPAIPLSVQDQEGVEIMSELGMILLMFGLGLHFSLRKLAAVGPTAAVGALMEIAVLGSAGYGLGRLFGWGQMDSIFLGAIVSVSSTTIIIKAFEDLGMAKERFAHVVFGILIVEDILAIAMIALLSGIVTTGTLAVGEVGVTLGRLSIFLASVLVVGLLAVPALLRYVARFRSDEMLLITALALCFGVSLLALKLGYSVALGAFLIGAIVAEAREHGKVETLVAPVRDMFSAIFFVAIGMLIRPDMLVTYAIPIFVITAVVVVGKVASCGLGAFLMGHGARSSMRVGMSLAQIGEFSFIIASLGLTLGVTSDFLYPVTVAVSAVTTLLTPYLIKGSDRAVTLGSRLVPRPIAGYATLYSDWAASLGGESSPSGQIRKLLRKWILQMLLNLALAAAIFLTAGALVEWARARLPALPAWTGGPEGLAWLTATVLSLPLLIVTWRKLRAVAMVTAEATVPMGPARTKEQTQAMRALISGIIRGLGAVVIIAGLLAMSAAMMPPWPVLAVLAGVAAVIAALRWRSFERAYARAQSSLVETLTRPPEPAVEMRPVPAALRGAVLETVEITADSPARGRLIRELALRSRTGASAVGIERNGESVINPGPDEELRHGDRVLLLGNSTQLEVARRLLAGHGAVPR
jgi:CPA2 family monovalent cation:H+ antiporter-2